MVVPVHPVQGRHFNRFSTLPGLTVNQLSLVQPVDGFSQGDVVAIALAADRGLDAGLRQSLGVADRDVLPTTVTMVNQATRAVRLTGVQGLLQGIEHEVGLHVGTDSPADDAPRKDVNHKGHVQLALPGRDIG